MADLYQSFCPFMSNAAEAQFSDCTLGCALRRHDGRCAFVAFVKEASRLKSIVASERASAQTLAQHLSQTIARILNSRAPQSPGSLVSAAPKFRL